MVHNEHIENDHFPPGLTCQKCGCSDASIRLVSFPFVYSMFFYSFSGEFKGRWCRRHATFYLLLAGLITGTAGFLGFSGLYFAPMTLLQLASGGKQNKGNNTKQLHSLAEAKLQRGDIGGAQDCYEASLRFQDDLWTQQELQKLSSHAPLQSAETTNSRIKQALNIIAIFLSASILGLFAGGAHYFLDDYLFSDYLWKYDVFEPFLSWIPLFAAGFPAVLWLKQYQDSLMEKNRFYQPVFIYVVAILIFTLFSLGVFEGRSIGFVIDNVLNGATLPPVTDFLLAIWALASRGAFIEILRLVQARDVMSALQFIFIILLGIYACLTLLLGAWGYCQWVRRLKQVQTQTDRFVHIPGWVASVLTVVILPSLAFMVPQKSVVDFIEARDHFYAGWRNEIAGDFPSAIEEFEEAVRLDPFMAEAFEELGWSHSESGNIQHAIEQYLKSIDINPNRGSAHYYLAREYYFSDEKELAFHEFGKALQLDPTLKDAQIGLAWTAYYLGDLDAAETQFQKILESSPGDYDAYLGLGYISEDRGEIEEQIASLENAAKIYNAPIEIFTHLGVAYYNHHKIDLAIEKFELAVSREDDNRYARTYLIMSYLESGAVDSAVELSQEAIISNPDWATPHALLAQAYVEMNELIRAKAEIEISRKFPELTETDQFLILQALLDTEQYEEVEKEVRQAIRTSYDLAGLYFYLSESFSRRGNFSEAFEACDLAEKAGARPSDVLVQQASIYIEQEKYDLSLNALQEAELLDPKSHTIHNLLSITYSEMEEYPMAVVEAEKAVELHGYNFSGYINLAFANLNVGDHQSAIRAAIRASELSPHYDLPYFVLGASQLALREPRYAYDAFSRFLELYRDEANSEELREQVDEAMKSIKESLDVSG
jgi:tetratricopeptide (TPR) repeat protein